MARLDRTTTAPRVVDTAKLTIESAAAGIAGTAAATLFILGAPALGLPRLRLPELLGRAMQGRGPDWVFAQAAGWAAFLVAGVLLAVGYGWMIKRLEPRAGAAYATAFGLAPWTFTNLIVFPMVGLGPFAARTHSVAYALESAVAFGLWGLVTGLVLDAAVSRTAIPVIGLRESQV